MSNPERGSGDEHKSLEMELAKLYRWRAEEEGKKERIERQTRELEVVAESQEQEIEALKQEIEGLNAVLAAEDHEMQQICDTVRHLRLEKELFEPRMAEIEQLITAGKQYKGEVERKTAEQEAWLDSIIEEITKLRLLAEQQAMEMKTSHKEKVCKIRQQKETAIFDTQILQTKLAAMRGKVAAAEGRVMEKSQQLSSARQQQEQLATSIAGLKKRKDNRIKYKEEVAAASAKEEEELRSQSSELSSQLVAASSGLAVSADMLAAERLEIEKRRQQLAMAKTGEAEAIQLVANRQAAFNQLKAELAAVEARLPSEEERQATAQQLADSQQQLEQLQLLQLPAAQGELASITARSESLEEDLTKLAHLPNLKVTLHCENLQLKSNILNMEQQLATLAEEHGARMNALRSKTQQVLQERDALAERVAELGASLVSRQQQNEERAQVEREQLLALQEKVNETNVAADELEPQIAAASERQAAAVIAKRAAETAIASLKVILAQTEDNIHQAETENRALMAQVEEQLDRRRQTAAKRAVVEQRTAAAVAQMEAAAAANKKSKSAMTSKASAIKKLKAEVQRTAKQLAAAEVREAKLSKQLAKNQADEEAMAAKVDQQQTYLAELEEKNSCKSAEVEGVVEKIAAMRQQLAQRSSMENDQRIAELKHKIEYQEEENQRQAALLDDLTSKDVQRIRSNCLALEKKIAEETERIRAIEMDRKENGAAFNQRRKQLEEENRLLKERLLGEKRGNITFDSPAPTPRELVVPHTPGPRRSATWRAGGSMAPPSTMATPTPVKAAKKSPAVKGQGDGDEESSPLRRSLRLSTLTGSKSNSICMKEVVISGAEGDDINFADISFESA